MALRPRQRCNATNRFGKRCRAWAIHGAKVCWTHGGATPQVKAAAQRRLALAAGLAEVARQGPPSPEADTRDPVEHLLAGLRWSALMVETLARVVADSDASPTSKVYDVWSQERDRYARIAKACVDAGVEQRLVEIEHAKAQAIAATMQAVFDDTRRLLRRERVDEAVLDRVWSELPAVMRRRLLQLDGADLRELSA